METPLPLPAHAAIAGRRDTRRFDPGRPLGDALLTQVLRLAALAPSEGNLQPWRFLVVRDERNRRRLRGCAYSPPELAEAPVAVIVLGYHHPHRSHLEAILERCLALGAISPEAAAEARARTLRAMERRSDPALWATRATMTAVATLLIAAEALGVASAMIERFDAGKIRQAFGVPDDHAVCALVALGFAAEAHPALGRFGLADVCFLEHFGQPWTLGEP